jgi:glucan phosphorylase
MTTTTAWNRIPTLHTADIELPRELTRLYDIAYNLWWSLEPARPPALLHHRSAPVDDLPQPVQLLIGVERSRWRDLLEDDLTMSLYSQVAASFERYLDEEPESWFPRRHPEAAGPIAYFCMEYGLHQSLPLYSGGLGVLAGDYLKSASDLGLPLVAIGLLYRSGYFHQTIDADGRQQHLYPEIDFARLPCVRRRAPPGARCSCRSRSPTARSRRRSGSARSAACRSCYSTPTCVRTTPPTVRSPRCSTRRGAKCGCCRRSSSASVARARSKRSASRRAPGT